jgi:DNA-binding SARP family transcriptional activator
MASATTARRAQTSPLARIHLLGSMRATSFRHADILPRGTKARALLGCLCLADGARVSRARIAAMLWDRVPDFQGRASFRQAYRELVVAFGPLAQMLLSSDRETVRLDTAACWIDAVALLSTDPGTEKGARGKLAELCKGDLLGRAERGQRVVRPMGARRALALHRAVAPSARRGDEYRERAAQRAERTRGNRAPADRVRSDARGASRVLMRALADRHERGRALAEYKRCQQALKLAYSVEPSPETRALYEAIRMFSRDTREVASPSLRPRPASRRRARRPSPSAVTGASVCSRSPQSRRRSTTGFRSRSHRSRRRARTLPLVRCCRPDGAGAGAGADLHQRQYVAKARPGLRGGRLRRAEWRHVPDQRAPAEPDAGCRPVWSKTVELPTDRLDQLDERVTAQIVSEIDPVIHYIEGRPRTRDNDDAIGRVLRAIRRCTRWSARNTRRRAG